MKKRGLGKGLSDLGVDALLTPTAAAIADKTTDTALTQLPLSALRPGRYQPRRYINPDNLQELAESIKAQGIIQPIVVRKVENAYEIIAGERRWRAAKLAGLAEVPVVVHDINDETALAMALIENIQRCDLNVIEEAMALQRLLQEFGMTHQEIAAAVGKSRATVTNLMRLLKLNQDVRDMVVQGQLEMGHARALLALEGEQQSAVANNIVLRGLSVRDAEQLVRKVQQPISEAAATQASPDIDIQRLASDLTGLLNTRVKITQNRGGRGQLIISYSSQAQRDEILNHFRTD